MYASGKVNDDAINMCLGIIDKPRPTGDNSSFNSCPVDSLKWPLLGVATYHSLVADAPQLVFNLLVNGRASQYALLNSPCSKVSLPGRINKSSKAAFSGIDGAVLPSETSASPTTCRNRLSIAATCSRNCACEALMSEAEPASAGNKSRAILVISIAGQYSHVRLDALFQLDPARRNKCH